VDAGDLIVFSDEPAGFVPHGRQVIINVLLLEWHYRDLEYFFFDLFGALVQFIVHRLQLFLDIILFSGLLDQFFYLVYTLFHVVVQSLVLLF